MKKRITPQSAKAKARRLQSWVAKQIAKVTGFPCGKDKPVEPRPMGQSGPDVRLEGQVLKVFPFTVECKWQETWAIPAWIRQVKKNQMEGTDWLLFCKKNRERAVVVMDAERFFDLFLRDEEIKK